MRELGFITVGPNGVIKVRRENGDHAFIDNANLGTLLSKLATAGWRLAPGQDVDHKIAQTILVRGLVEIEVERPAFYDEPEGPAPMRYASVELDGTENREVIQKRFERNGWDLIDMIRPDNTLPKLIFSKPYAAPDLPFN